MSILILNSIEKFIYPESFYYLFEHRHHKFYYLVVQLIIPNKRCHEEQSTENAIIPIGCIFLPVYHRHLYPNSLVLVHAYTGEKIRKKYVAILQQKFFPRNHNFVGDLRILNILFYLPC